MNLKVPFCAASNSMAAFLYGLDSSIAKLETNLQIMYLFNVLKVSTLFYERAA